MGGQRSQRLRVGILIQRDDRDRPTFADGLDELVCWCVPVVKDATETNTPAGGVGRSTRRSASCITSWPREASVQQILSSSADAGPTTAIVPRDAAVDSCWAIALLSSVLMSSVVPAMWTASPAPSRSRFKVVTRCRANRAIPGSSSRPSSLASEPAALAAAIPSWEVTPRSRSRCACRSTTPSRSSRRRQIRSHMADALGASFEIAACDSHGGERSATDSVPILGQSARITESLNTGRAQERCRSLTNHGGHSQQVVDGRPRSTMQSRSQGKSDGRLRHPS